MGTIQLHNIQLYAFHGCLEEEQKIGSDYSVDVTLNLDLNKSANSDDLSDTLDYVTVYRIIEEEMKIPSNLLEHVAGRILERFFAQSNELTVASVTVTKVNPPIMGNVESVSVTLSKSS